MRPQNFRTMKKEIHPANYRLVVFKDMSIGITGKTSTLAFNNLTASPQYTRYKLSTSYLEIPVELRFFSNPYKINKSFIQIKNIVLF